MTVIVSLGVATICFLGQCYPALVGKTTPPGQYILSHRFVVSPGYGGDVLAFKEGEHDLFAIHRVWLGAPSQHRGERLVSTNVARRQGVTDGCINVSAPTYDLLVDCCSGSTLIVN
ncbi:MAG: murein L,D-transpeptidase [Rhizomicrobium sp.]